MPWINATNQPASGADLYRRYHPNESGGARLPPTAYPGKPPITPTPAPSGGWTPVGATPPTPNLDNKGMDTRSTSANLTPPNLDTGVPVPKPNMGGGGNSVNTQHPTNGGGGAELYGGYTPAQLLANPALANSLGEPAASRWRARQAGQQPSMPPPPLPPPTMPPAGGGDPSQFPITPTPTVPGGGLPTPPPPTYANGGASWRNFLPPDDPNYLPMPAAAGAPAVPTPTTPTVPAPDQPAVMPPVQPSASIPVTPASPDAPINQPPGQPSVPTPIIGRGGNTQAIGSKGRYGGAPPADVIAQRKKWAARRASKPPATTTTTVDNK